MNSAEIIAFLIDWFNDQMTAVSNPNPEGKRS
jgi:hypothetical protein